MSFMNPNDMVEEDAADLQFPKDKSVIQKCCSCYKALQEPFIKCAECSDKLCLKCFSCGAETLYHRNTHSYIIIHDNTKVFSYSDWTGSEEKQLLNLLLASGYGNWEDVATGMKNKTPRKCQEHYNAHYFNGIFKQLLGLSTDHYFSQRHPYLYKINSSDPPRYCTESISFKNMAGYRSARGDFDIPFDNSAESTLSHLDMNDWPDSCRILKSKLHYAIFKVFNRRIIERERRYKIIRSHGILMASRTFGWISNYSEALGPSHGSGKLGSSESFISFMQLTNGICFDNLVESLQKFIELRKYIYKLYEIRSNGIITFYGGKIYQKLKNKRLLKLNIRTRALESLSIWRTLIPNYTEVCREVMLNNSIFSYSQPRRKAAPIDILGLPGYDKLTDGERTLCSTSRIVPRAYLEYKNILILENSKIGFLRLAEARRLIKIDVNKTRQLYDFLLNKGFINKPF